MHRTQSMCSDVAAAGCASVCRDQASPTTTNKDLRVVLRTIWQSTPTLGRNVAAKLGQTLRACVTSRNAKASRPIASTRSSNARISGFNMRSRQTAIAIASASDFHLRLFVGIFDAERWVRFISVGAEESLTLRPNVRAKRETTAGRQARAGENVQRTTGPGLVACRWRSA